MSLDAVRALQARQQAEREAAEATAQAERSGGADKRKATDSALDDRGRDELLDMCAEVDLLSLIQADTGETGNKSGDRTDFNSCPVCGHRGCFTYYHHTNTWACFGGSNKDRKAGKIAAGGNVLDYLEHARHMDATERVTWLREETGHPFEPRAKDGGSADKDSQGGGGYLLPPPDAVRASDPPPLNPALIPGVLRRGCIGTLAGKAKVGKSIAAIELCICVAVGGEWFGREIEGGGNCLFIDPEIQASELHGRFSKVARAMGADTALVDSRVTKWTLRGATRPDGAPATIADVAHDVEKRYKYGDFSLIVVDSCSALLEGDENSSLEVRRFLARVLRISKATGAAILLILHFGKALAGDRSAADRARGSSVWTDAPDAVLTLTEVLPPSGKPSDYLADGEYACILESGGLRSFGRMEPTRVIFKYPNPLTDAEPTTPHRLDAAGVTESWKPDSSTRKGADKTNELKNAQKRADRATLTAALLAYYYAEGIGEDGLILKEAAEAVGVDSRTLSNALEGCEYLELVQVTQRKRYVRPKRAPKAPPPALPLGSD